MYAYNSATTGMNNNPFVSDPTNASSRFPNIDDGSSPQNAQFTSWLQPGIVSNQTGYPQQQQQQQQQIPAFQQQQQLAPSYSYQQSGSGFAGPRPAFQPSSSFGQQLTAQVNGSSYGYLAGQTQSQQQQQPYNPVQQQLQSPAYVAQFDPYASLGQLEAQNPGAGGRPQIQTSQSQSGIPPITSPLQTTSTASSTTSMGPNGQPHPREYIRTHKLELEAWDNYAWKQAIGTFEGLKDAWETRKKDIEARAAQLKNQLQYGQGGYYVDQIQQEGARLQGLFKEADLNFGSVAASVFQMGEVFAGYRQSGDLSSKRRVREALNAALQGLPDWPTQSI